MIYMKKKTKAFGVRQVICIGLALSLSCIYVSYLENVIYFYFSLIFVLI